MIKRVVIFGKCGPDVDAKALKAVVRFVSDTQPDELVCIEHSIPVLEGLREVYDGRVSVHASNVEARFGTSELSESGYHRIAPGWISTANEDCVEVSRIAGNTALNAARKYNTCVALGHTGRMGIGSETKGYGSAAATTITGMEVGNLLDRKLARSLENGQQGFGMLVIGQHCDCPYTRVGPCHNRADDGQHVRPETVPITRGKLTVDGKTWEV
jgi:hypothetical protein